MTELKSGDRVHIQIDEEGTVTEAYSCCGVQRLQVELATSNGHMTSVDAAYATVLPPVTPAPPVGQVRQSPSGDYVIRRADDTDDTDEALWEGSRTYYTDAEAEDWPILYTPTRYRYFKGSSDFTYRVPADATPGTLAQYRESPSEPWRFSVCETLDSLRALVARSSSWEEVETP